MFMTNTENQNQNMHAVTSEFETVGMGLRELKDRNLPEMGREGCAGKPLPTTEEVSSSNRCRGIVKWFNPTKGFGFITPSSGGIDVFVHQSEIQLSGFRSLAQGEPVEYELYDGEKGPKALQVTGPEGSQVKGAPREVKPKVETKSSKTSDNTQVPVPKYIKVGNHFIQVTSNTQVPVSASVLAPTPITSAIPMYSSPSPATQFSQYILTNTGVPQTNFYQEIPMDMRAMPMSPQPMMIDQSHMTTMSPQYYPMAHPMGMSPTPQMTQMGMSPSTPTPQFAYPGHNFTQHTMQSPMQINTMQSGMNSPQIDYTQLNSENPFEQTNSFFAQEYIPNPNQMGMEIASPMSPQHEHHC